jgi:hypothetical protein
MSAGHLLPATAGNKINYGYVIVAQNASQPTSQTALERRNASKGALEVSAKTHFRKKIYIHTPLSSSWRVL